MGKAASDFGIESIAVSLPTQHFDPRDFGGSFSDEYYETVSGPLRIFQAGPEENAFSLALAAARKVLASQSIDASCLDAIFVVTLPTEPVVAPYSSRLHGALGASRRTFCLDIIGSCAGFLQGVDLILSMASARSWKKVLLVNVETLTKIIRADDTPVRLLLSDGAAACIFGLEPSIIFDGIELFQDGSRAEILGTKEQKMHMNGPKVYESVLREIPGSFLGFEERYSPGRESVDFFFFHQASARVLSKLTEALGLDPEKVPSTIRDFGNLGSCSLPHLILQTKGKSLGKRKTAIATAFGAGFYWGHAFLRIHWSERL